MRPFWPYYGSAWQKGRRLPAPRHTKVIEPFAGAAGYATWYDAPWVDLYDVDPVIVGLWRYLLRVSPAEIMALPELPEIGDSVDNYAIPQEAKWLIGFWLNRGSASPKKTRTAYSARTDKAQLNWSRAAKVRIVEQLPKIAGWTIHEGSYDRAPDVEATWLVDPPFVGKGKFYRYSEIDYPALGAWCRARRGQLIVLESTGADWLPFRSDGDFKSTKGKAEEMVYEMAYNELAHLA